jgi:type IV pilus assembly protein PilF
MGLFSYLSSATEKVTNFCILTLGCLLITGCASLLQTDREAAELHFRMGTSFLANGAYPQALEELSTAEKLDSQSAPIQNNLGLVYFLRGKYDLAEKYLLRALELSPKYSDARNNLSRVYIEQKKYPLAIQEATAVLNDLTYPFPEKPYYNLALAQFHQNMFQAAEQNFLKVIEIQRDHCLALSYYGRCLFEQKEYKRSSLALDKAVGFCQKNQFDEPNYFSALSYFRQGDLTKTEARLHEIIKLYPQGKYVDKARDMLETIKK